MDHIDTLLGIVGVIVGFLALALALPPFFQMMGGGPKVRVRFIDTVEAEGRVLICEIHNLPIRSRALKFMRVSRTPIETFATFDIREQGTKKIVASAFRPMLRDTKSDAEALALAVRPPLPVVFSLVAHTKAGPAYALNSAPGEPDHIVLNPGEYFADVKVATSDSEVAAVAQSFTVGQIKEGTFWTTRKIDEKW